MVSIDETERNKRWFQKQLELNDFTYRSLAAKLNLSGPDVSRIVNGQRNIQADEVVKMARLLNVSVDDILKRSKATNPIERYERNNIKKSPYATLIGAVGPGGAITKTLSGKMGSRKVMRPARVSEDCVAVIMVDVASLWLDWVFYFTPVDYIHEKAAGKMCAIVDAEGEQFLGFVQPAGGEKNFQIFSLDGQEIKKTKLKSASPVCWARQDAA